METLTVTQTFMSLACIVAVAVTVKVVNWVWLRPKKLEKFLKQQGLPGTSYKFLFGDVKEFASLRSQALEHPMLTFSHDYLPRTEPYRHQVITKLGKDWFIWGGTMPVVNISNPELVKEAFTKIQDFRKMLLNPIADKLLPGLVSYEGEKWAKHRKIIVSAFHLEKLKLMLPAFYESCSEMISKWEKIVAETGSGEVDAWKYVTTLSADVISRAAFGSSYQEGQHIFELLKQQTAIAVDSLGAIYVPGMRFIPTARNRRFMQLQAQIQSSLRGIVNKRKEEIASGEAKKADLLGILLNSNAKEMQKAGRNANSQKHGLSLQEVIDECKLFYFAGQETTSILIVWTLILLSKYQDWQTRARDEVLLAFGKDLPNFDGLNHLKTVTMILYEVLRLYPPASALTRTIPKDTRLGDLSLPAGAMLSVPVAFIHRDKQLWGDDADDFKPERFSDGVSKATRGNNNAFFAFGWGPRTCLGEKFALTEARMALSMILQRFSLELSPSYAHAPRTVLFLEPQYGAQIILRKL